MPRFVFLSALILWCAVAAQAQLRLPNLLSDHAVLQRDQPVRIWGWAEGDDAITVQFHHQSVATKSNSLGEWEAWLKPEPAGGPYVLTVSSGHSGKPVARDDILVGDVWVASGQSNMEFPLGGFSNAPVASQEKDIAAATNPRLRLLKEQKTASPVPQAEVNGVWMLCKPETVRHISAVAYFFAKEISERENVPVGILDATWGGTPAHSWISLEGLATASLLPAFRNGGIVAREQGRADQIKAQLAQEDLELQREGKPRQPHPRIPGDRSEAWAPGALFNGMIAPDTNYSIKGVIWYQGESDSEPDYAPNYERVFPALISDWRRQWHEGDFPFLFVQISSFDIARDGWPVVRDAQRRTLALRNTAMAVTLDVGDAKNIHPADKQTVGARLAHAALAMAYGEQIPYRSPEFLRATSEPGALRVWFSDADGLNTRGQALAGFEVTGEDRKFVPAAAKIERIAGQDTVLVSAPQIANPTYVRYGWSGVVTSYLLNESGLPLGTFTSE